MKLFPEKLEVPWISIGSMEKDPWNSMDKIPWNLSSMEFHGDTGVVQMLFKKNAFIYIYIYIYICKPFQKKILKSKPVSFIVLWDSSQSDNSLWATHQSDTLLISRCCHILLSSVASPLKCSKNRKMVNIKACWVIFHVLHIGTRMQYFVICWWGVCRIF